MAQPVSPPANNFMFPSMSPAWSDSNNMKPDVKPSDAIASTGTHLRERGRNAVCGRNGTQAAIIYYSCSINHTTSCLKLDGSFPEASRHEENNGTNQCARAGDLDTTPPTRFEDLTPVKAPITTSKRMYLAVVVEPARYKRSSSHLCGDRGSDLETYSGHQVARGKGRGRCHIKQLARVRVGCTK